MDNISAPVVTVLMGIIGVAILAVLVSRNSNTQNIIKETATGFSTGLETAISPIMGGGYQMRKSGGF